MILDTSALIAILRDEPEAAAFARAIEAAPIRRLSAASYVEVGAVIDGQRDPVASRRVDELIAAAGIIVEPVTESQARAARQAYRDFGKGSGHPAGLNYGDCFSYALATLTAEPLLFKGADFAHAGVLAAIAQDHLARVSERATPGDATGARPDRFPPAGRVAGSTSGRYGRSRDR